MHSSCTCFIFGRGKDRVTFGDNKIKTEFIILVFTFDLKIVVLW